MKNEPTVTILLKDYVAAILGQNYWHDRPISKETALTIFSITQNKFLCFIQFSSEDGKPLEKPVLWDYAAWQDVAEHTRLARNYSHRQRVERFLFEDNVKTISKAWQDYASVSEEAANVVARRVLTPINEKKIRVFYDGLIKTKEEEL